MISENKRDTAELWLIPTIITVVVIVIIGYQYGFWLAYNDDVTISAVLSGVYSGSPDIHCIYMSPILSGLFVVLYRLIPAVPWHGLFLAGSQFWSLWLCCRCICKKAGRTWLRIAGSVSFACLFYALLIYWLVFSQYTMTAGILAETAVFLVLLDRQEPDGKPEWKSMVLPAVLFTLSILVRNNVGLLHLPFLGVVCAYKVLWTGDRKPGRTETGLLLAAAVFLIWGAAFSQEYIIELWVVCFVLLGCWAIVWLVKCFRKQAKLILKYGAFFAVMTGIAIGSRKLTGMIYATDTWIEYSTFNVYRTDIYDFYGLPDYGENTELYESLGLTQEDYFSLLLYDYVFSDNINAYVMQTLSEYAQPERESVLDDIRETLLTVVNRIRDDSEEPDDDLILLVLAAAILICVLAGDMEAVLQLPFLYFGYILCWFYLYWVGRVATHVYHGISFAVILILVGICLLKIEKISQSSYREVLCGGLIASGAVSLWLNLSQSVLAFEESYDSHMENNKRWEAYRDYCLDHPENLYFTDTEALAGTGPENMFIDRRTEMQNYVLASGWMANSPLYYEKLNYYGIEESFASELEDGGTLYYICGSNQSAEWISHYICPADISVEVQRVDGIYVDSEEVFTVYAVFRNDL